MHVALIFLTTSLHAICLRNNYCFKLAVNKSFLFFLPLKVSQHLIPQLSLLQLFLTIMISATLSSPVSCPVYYFCNYIVNQTMLYIFVFAWFLYLLLLNSIIEINQIWQLMLFSINSSKKYHYHIFVVYCLFMVLNFLGLVAYFSSGALSVAASNQRMTYQR